MSKPTPEQEKELWEGCGLSIQGCEDFPGVISTQYWVDANGTPIDPPIVDLNNLFKYAVPKFKSGLLYMHFTQDPYTWSLGFKTLDNYVFDYVGSCFEDPALALFWAIWEVIHE